MTKYSRLEVLNRLKRLSGWRLEGEEIKKDYGFRSFSEAMKFVNQVADFAEHLRHHPAILVDNQRVTLTLSTHEQGGITESDFNLAEQVERRLMDQRR